MQPGAGAPELVILVPVLRRPHRVRPLLRSIQTATTAPYRVLFIADPDDEREQRAIRRAQGEMLVCAGCYARKINAGVAATGEPLIFLGADDLEPQPGWLEAATDAMQQGVEVVGVNDMIDRRPGREQHATHFLMTRSYAKLPTLAGDTGPLSEAYAHNFVDDELIATATKRGVYTYAAGSLVRHHHPMAGAPDDETYRLGRAPFEADRQLFHARRHLWT